MITQDRLMQILIKGRYECYARKSTDYNPYVKSDLYDWKFTLPIDNYSFTDAYRGFNPYSGVEYIYVDQIKLPIWSCDYIGYVNLDSIMSAEAIYAFLKEARGVHLMNCQGNLFFDYEYENEFLRYKTYFQGNLAGLLQKEEFFYKNKLVAQQLSAGRLNEQLLRNPSR
ncbi:DUF5680 domain-containing protein [Desulfitobacterium sp. PCE1]|uniref:DUF5680 domain-containing protein n=1 Tax=Desulfitobacterium sp. PCE1 TaxID=146907 RepID=UPI000380E34A|nr:DUF5680 domain-containing protein [Desulfitobacterium sp. PCE1]